MPIFAIQKMEEIKGKQTFYKLSVDSVCLLDDFYQTIESNPQYLSEFIGILSRMECVANNQLLPKNLFRPIVPKSHGEVKEYEFKSKNLRVYSISREGGKIVICGGYKNSQKADIRWFQSLKKQYIESL